MNRDTRPLWPLACCALLLGLPDESWARTKRPGNGVEAPAQNRRFKVEADESVAEQLNDPTAFLREARIDMAVEHGTGSDHTLLETTPTLAMPLSDRLRFEGGIPLLFNGPGDSGKLELGDIFASLSYIFYQSVDFGALAEVRADLPTGNESQGAGLGVTQAHASLGSVIYTFEDQDILLVPFVEYRRSVFGGGDSPSVSHLIGTVGVVYLWSDETYIRSDWTLNFDGERRWHSSALLNLEIGRVFANHYAVVLGYEFDLWGDADIRNQVTLSLGYLF